VATSGKAAAVRSLERFMAHPLVDLHRAPLAPRRHRGNPRYPMPAFSSADSGGPRRFSGALPWPCCRERTRTGRTARLQEETHSDAPSAETIVPGAFMYLQECKSAPRTLDRARVCGRGDSNSHLRGDQDLNPKVFVSTRLTGRV